MLHPDRAAVLVCDRAGDCAEPGVRAGAEVHGAGGGGAFRDEHAGDGGDDGAEFRARGGDSDHGAVSDAEAAFRRVAERAGAGVVRDGAGVDRVGGTEGDVPRGFGLFGGVDAIGNEE